VISTNNNDELEFKQKWGMEKDEQERVIDNFNDKDSELKFLIVTAKLLTGFDSPVMQTMYLDKSLKDHTLLQAICRTNRLYPNKTFGCIVDYFGIFDDAAEALQFDEKTVTNIITNLKLLKDQLPGAVEACLGHFPGVDRTVEGFEGLEAAQECIKTDELRDDFAKDYVVLAKLWESLSPDSVINPYLSDYRWLSQVYQSVQPAVDNIGKMLWFAFGAQTTKLIHENIHVGDLHDDLEEFIMDADVIDDLFNNPNPKKIKKLEKELIKRFKRQQGNPKFKALSERLEELRDRAEQGLISSIEFVKELCKLAKETLEAEQELLTEIEKKSAKEALTDLFLELKTDQTPAVVERIVNDIDDIVKIVRFDGWQTTTSGEREVQRSLRKTLLKYKLHKEQDLFEKAYAYIKQYY
jgi:type I restriction enzyme R subunit